MHQASVYFLYVYIYIYIYIYTYTYANLKVTGWNSYVHRSP